MMGIGNWEGEKSPPPFSCPCRVLGFTDRMAKKGIEIITINYSLITSFFTCPNRALEREGLGGCARTSVACKTKSETGKPRVSAGSSPRGFTARLLRMAM